MDGGAQAPHGCAARSVFWEGLPGRDLTHNQEFTKSAAENKGAYCQWPEPTRPYPKAQTTCAARWPRQSQRSRNSPYCQTATRKPLHQSQSKPHPEPTYTPPPYCEPGATHWPPPTSGTSTTTPRSQ